MSNHLKELIQEHLTHSTVSEKFENFSIGLKQFEEFNRYYVIQAIQGLRYGQAFCNYFDITDYRLYYHHDMEYCQDLIKSEYIQYDQKTKNQPRSRKILNRKS